MFKVIKEDKVN